MKSWAFLSLVIVLSIESHAQKVIKYDASINTSSRNTELGSFGFGAGIDYGAFGIKLTVVPEKHIGLFLGGGILGYNIGGDIRLRPGRKITPTLSAMYGLNAMIIHPGVFSIFKGYRGYSVGLGAELKAGLRRNNFWKFQLLVPFRTAEYENDVGNYNANGYSISDAWPVVVSVGFHLAISN
ncbi:hypothetical protein BH09BAC3_BH09BAC3_07650 [soil metagenome]